MKYWITTDTHFGHDKMPEYCGRPENFSSRILTGFLKIPEGDVLIHLGDVCIGKDEYHNDVMQSHLSCKTWLVRGNHDKKSDSWYMAHGWDFVATGIRMIQHGKKVLLSHVPQPDDGWFDLNIHGHLHNNLPRIKRKEWVTPDEEERNKGLVELLTPKHLLVSLELHGYEPKRLDSLIQESSNT